MNKLTLDALARLARMSIAPVAHANQSAACEIHDGNGASAPATNGLSVVTDGQLGSVNNNIPAAQNPNDSVPDTFEVGT